MNERQEQRNERWKSETRRNGSDRITERESKEEEDNETRHDG